MQPAFAPISICLFNLDKHLRYDLKGFPERSMEACEGIDESASLVKQLLREENAAAPSVQLVLAGFR